MGRGVLLCVKKAACRVGTNELNLREAGGTWVDKF